MIYCHREQKAVPKEKANCRDYNDWPTMEFIRLKADEVCQSCPFNKSESKPDVDKWEQLRTWLNNLLKLSSVKKTDKKGIKIALNVMDRIDEAAER